MSDEQDDAYERVTTQRSTCVWIDGHGESPSRLVGELQQITVIRRLEEEDAPWRTIDVEHLEGAYLQVEPGRMVQWSDEPVSAAYGETTIVPWHRVIEVTVEVGDSVGGE